MIKLLKLQIITVWDAFLYLCCRYYYRFSAEKAIAIKGKTYFGVNGKSAI